jgi:hypothetical protein
MFTAPVEPDDATVDVLTAFQSARAAFRSPVECYRAGVDAWRQHHPEHAPKYAARRAVAVILAYVVELTVTSGPR